MSRVLVLGGAGYIGRVLIPTLQADGHEVACVDNLFFGQDAPIECDFYKIDCNVLNFPGASLDKVRLMRLILEADVIIPLAALVGMPLCKSRPELAEETNLQMIQSLLEFESQLQGSRYIVFPNTNSSYGTTADGVVCTEDTPMNPISLYAETKDKAESMILSRGHACVFRLATVFGVSPRMRLDLLVNTLTYDAYFDKYISVFDGDFRRNYVHVQDVCDAFAFAIRTGLQGVFNLGHDESNMTKLSLCEKVKEHLHANLAVIKKTDPDQRDYEVSSAKLAKAGFEAKVGLDDGIKELMCYFGTLPRDSREREELVRSMRNA